MTLIEEWLAKERPVECDPFDDRRYLQKISLLLLLFSIVLQFAYGKGFKAQHNTIPISTTRTSPHLNYHTFHQCSRIQYSTRPTRASSESR